MRRGICSVGLCTATRHYALNHLASERNTVAKGAVIGWRPRAVNEMRFAPVVGIRYYFLPLSQCLVGSRAMLSNESTATSRASARRNETSAWMLAVSASRPSEGRNRITRLG
ncbi:hypothetical protein RC74_13615 [Falsihalocynthiibacter arcticus]|uniref:Uncharacterized protein n=1 Tax=Falsihalocynthiibacter arcticus TaxID=1579316 RepID=A0A126V1H5_9RHOB|nr:hypothetical protein RC74_13615 [Falsihalocynthiibacter arcticus]